MIFIDSMIGGGLKFVLRSIASAVDAEMNSVEALRDELLRAEMRLELGEIDEEEHRRIEQDILERLRDSRAGESGRGGDRQVWGAGVRAEVVAGDERLERPGGS